MDRILFNDLNCYQGFIRWFDSPWGLVGEVHGLSREVEAQVKSIAKPHLGVRIGVGLVVVVLLLTLIPLVGQIPITASGSWIEWTQAINAATSEIIYLAAGFIFLVTWETRIKRRRVVKAVRRLRELAHIVDMLQLTKDPYGVAGVSWNSTDHSPRRDLDAFELGRYLDYCSETLSLLAKLGYFYTAYFDDPEATEAVSDLEDLANDLSRKVWQKIMVLRSTGAHPQLLQNPGKPSLDPS